MAVAVDAVPVAPDLATVRALAREHGLVPVCHTFIADCETPVSAFLKLPALHALAPTQTEAPFKMTQLATLVFFIVMGALSVKKFHIPESVV